MTLKVGNDSNLIAKILDNQIYFKIFILTFILFFVVLFLSAQEFSSRDEPGLVAVFVFSLVIALIITLGFWIKDRIDEWS